MPGEFKDFDRYEAAGGDNREKFRPPLTQEEANPLHAEQTCINESTDAELPQLLRRNPEDSG